MVYFNAIRNQVAINNVGNNASNKNILLMISSASDLNFVKDRTRKDLFSLFIFIARRYYRYWLMRKQLC